MTWQGIQGHDEVVERFRAALRRGRLASSFLFVGPAGVGKRALAVKLAQSMLCQRVPEELLDACGQCPSCTQVIAGSHPDLMIVAKPPDKADIPVALLIGDREHRMQEGLCRDLSLRPFMGGRRIAVIDDADYLNAEGANCLLKTLEEPPPRSVLILIGTSAARQLPTIRSRCQLVRFRPLPAETVARLLVSQGLVAEPADAERAAALSQGSLTRALELADAELWAFRSRLLAWLAEPSGNFSEFCKAVSAVVDAAGREAPLRRRRLRQLTRLAIDFYRCWLLTASGCQPGADAELLQSVAKASQRRSDGQTAAAACLDRCLEAAEQIDRNVNQTTLIECWLDDLAAGG